MALEFPASPQLDEIYTVGDRSWKWNGLGWEKVSSGASVPVDAAVPMAIATFYPGKPLGSEVFMSFVTPWPLAFTSGLPCSKATALAAPAGVTVYSIRKKGVLDADSVEVGTVTFSPANPAGVFASAGFAMASGDLLTVVAPSVPDATLSDVSMSITAFWMGGC